MAAAAPSTMRCGVTEWKPSGIGLTIAASFGCFAGLGSWLAFAALLHAEGSRTPDRTVAAQLHQHGAGVVFVRFRRQVERDLRGLAVPHADLMPFAHDIVFDQGPPGILAALHLCLVGVVEQRQPDRGRLRARIAGRNLDLVPALL